MTAYDTLANEYDAGRIGYANELYDTLIGYGLKPGHEILDLGCGSGLASMPLIENAFRVTGIDPSDAMLAVARNHLPAGKWVQGSAEKLPFADGSFDAVICAQAFHHFERSTAMRELLRVLRPGGIVAIWWKHLMIDDPVRVISDEVMQSLGHEPIASGLKGGFREFYGADLADHTLRVIPWRTTMGLKQYLSYERSRKIVRDTLGARADEYFRRLETKLHERYGLGDPALDLNYTHYLYLGKTRA